MLEKILTACLTSLFVFSDVSLTAQEDANKNEQSNASSYKTPYELSYKFSKDDLLFDFTSADRGDPKKESSVLFVNWNSKYVLDQYGSWGPPPRHYPQPKGSEEKSAEWKRERLIAVGLRFEGYGYQHHHLPDWEPPEGWPWKEVASGKNGKGVDCSNFTAFIYNMALGIRTSSDVKVQSERLKMESGRGFIEAQRIEKPASYEDCEKAFKTGDLLFIEENGSIVHTIMWVGPIGRSPDGEPLILDSTGVKRKDCKGIVIPEGVHLRPFGRKSWYFENLSHAIRVIRDE